LEQAFFVMVQLPYLQPFDDVNQRVSHLAANIPFIKANLSPLSFTDVARAIYTEAVLGIYELNKIDLLKDVFIWAYERSAARYAAVRQSLGEPDPLRLKHRAALRQIVDVLGPFSFTKFLRRRFFEFLSAGACRRGCAKLWTCVIRHVSFAVNKRMLAGVYPPTEG